MRVNEGASGARGAGQGKYLASPDNAGAVGQASLKYVVASKAKI